MPTGFDVQTLGIATRAFAPAGLSPSTEGFFYSHLERHYDGTQPPEVVQTEIILAVAETMLPDAVVGELAAASTAGELVTAGLAKLHETAEVQALGLLDQANVAGATRPLVAASYAAMVKAHHIDQHQVRKTGRPYYYHPLEVAAKTLDAVKGLEAHGHVVPDDLTQAVVSKALTHDITEDQAHPHKRGSNEYSPLFSAMTVYYMHRIEGNNFRDKAAEATRLLERPEPWAGTREEYIGRIAGKLIARLTKASDVTHNLWERKPATTTEEIKERDEHEARYRDSFEEFVEATTSDGAPVWEPLYYEHIASNEDQESMQAKVDALYEYMGVARDWLVSEPAMATA